MDPFLISPNIDINGLNSAVEGSANQLKGAITSKSKTVVTVANTLSGPELITNTFMTLIRSIVVDPPLPNAKQPNTTVNNITTDVGTVKTFINALETAAGNNTIYRGIFFNVIGQYNTSSTFNLEPLLGPTGLNATGGVIANGFSYPPAASAYDPVNDTLYPESHGSPTRIKYRPDMTDGAAQSYYYNEVRAGLNSVGFSL